MTEIVFDIGGVLVDWQPHRAFEHILGSRKEADDFMERVGFTALNARGDGGELFADLATEIDDPDDSALLARYVELYPLTVENAISGTWAILDRLLAQGKPVHAITNWSAETWPRGLTVQPRLGEVFSTLVVSGQEGLMKPDRRIYELLCERAGLSLSDCLFVDDGPHNVEGARKAGMDAVHFTSPAALEAELTERGLL